MGKGVIDIESHEVVKWFLAGKRLDDIKELLLLPETYSVEKVYEPTSKEEISIVVASPDIPDVHGEGSPIKICPHYTQDEKDKKRLASIGMWVPPRTISIPYDDHPALTS